jgi:hypothetical protein
VGARPRPPRRDVAKRVAFAHPADPSRTSWAPHKLSVKIEGKDEEHLATMVTAFEPVLESITIPAKAAT